jgi:hypothetical protein
MLKKIKSILKKCIDRIFEAAEIRDGVIHCPCGYKETYGKNRYNFKCPECRRGFTSDTGLGTPRRCKCKEPPVHYGGPL